ncbi:hypothetical protein [Hypnocyclicus thermotrophus]|uniref:hypothetical protein n=1 Tax=Hypnocyclicus thermotrophus TaxID=1627895 RepID=UPI001416F378|nr:hypothetical protein [Hypnocyclicus thermotrophus]
MYLETKRLILVPAYKINVKKVLEYLIKNKEFLKPYEPKKMKNIIKFGIKKNY